jgi:HlyD family secretion protein
MNKTLAGIILFAAIIIIATLSNRLINNEELPEGFASGNGRIEATEYDIASKLPGRVAEIHVQEGEQVAVDQIIATLDTRELDARIKQAQAGIEQARQAEVFAQAVVAQRKSEQALAQKNLQRSLKLYETRSIPLVQLQQSETAVLSAEAGVAAAQAQVIMQGASINAAIAQLETIQSSLQDSTLRSPINGRVLYRLVEPGEVIGPGGRVATVLDLNDVFMNIYLPTKDVGKVAMAAEARIILDALPEAPIPATVSFIAPRAQFTPREVETREEREKMMFRVKVKIHPDFLNRDINQVKTGLPSEAIIRLDKNAEWPEKFQVKHLPSQ